MSGGMELKGGDHLTKSKADTKPKPQLRPTPATPEGNNEQSQAT